MPAPYSAGSIFVSVVPSFKDNQRDIAREYQRRGEEASKAFSEGFDKKIAQDLPKAMEKAARGTRQAQAEAGETAGKEYSSAFRKTLVDGLKSAQTDLERLRGPSGSIEVPVGVDKKKFENQFNAIVRDVNLTRADVEVGADVGQAIFDVDRLINKMRELRDASTNPEVRTNLGAGLGAMETATTRARKMANLEPEAPTPTAPRQQGAFNRGLSTRLGAALQALPPVSVDADTSIAEKKIMRFRAAAFKMLDDLEAGIDVDTEQTLARVQAMMTLLEGVIETADPTAEIDASFNAAGALAQMKTWTDAVSPVEVPIEPEMGFFRARVATLLKTAGEALPEIPIDADSSDAQQEMARIRTELMTLSGDVKVGMDLDEVREKARTLQHELGALRRDNVELEVDVDAARAIIELQRIESAADDADRALDGSSRSADDGANSFRAFSAAVLLVAAAGPLAIPIIGAIGFSLAALGPLALAGAAGLGVFALATMGLSDAVSAMGEVQDNAAEDAKAYADGVRNAARSVASAEQGLANARRSAADSAVQSRERIVRATERVEDAERDLRDAQRDAQRAQEGLTQAREDYAERMLDLELQARGGALATRRAYMQLAEAEVAYANAMADPGATRTEREQLLLDLDEQKLRVDQVALSNRRLGEEQAEANAKGVEGSDEVVSAQERIEAANQRVGDTQEALSEAIADVAKAQADSQRAAADSAAAIEQAQARLVDAQLDYMDAIDATSASQDKLAESMAKLSPAGRAFAEYLFSLKPFFTEMRAVAQEGLLPGLQSWMQSIIGTYGPQLLSIVSVLSTALGDMFVGFGEALQGPEWAAFFDMLESKGPVFLGQIGQVLTNLGTGVASLMVAFAPAAEDFGNGMVRASESFANWAAGLRDSEGFQSFMEWWERVGPKVIDFFKALGGAVATLAVALAPYAEDLLEVVTVALNFIADMDPQTLGAIAIGVLGVATAFQTLVGLRALIAGFGTIIGLASAAMAVFNGTAVGTTAVLTGIAGIVAIAVAALVLLGIGLYLLWTRSETFRDIVTGAWNAIQAAVGVVVDWFQTHVQPVIETVLGAIGDFFSWLWRDIIEPIFAVWQVAWGVLWDFIMAMWENVGRPVIETIWSIIQELWDIIGPILTLIGMAFQFVWFLLQTAWETQGKRIFEDVMAIITWVWEKVIGPTLNFIAEGFGWLWGILQSAWETVGKPIFDLIEAIVVALVDVFQGSFDGIKAIWDALLDVFMAPIVFVVETVLNKGLIAGINWVASIFTDDDTWIDPIPTDWIPGRAYGGTIPGSSPHKRADNVLIRATAGEYMHDVDATNYYGEPLMDALNARLIPREALVAGLQGRAYGGLIDPMWARVSSQFPNARLTSHYRPGDPGYHGRRKAIDIAGSRPYPQAGSTQEMLTINRWIANTFGSGVAQLIHTQPGAINLLNGRPHSYNADTQAEHRNHVHWAMESMAGVFSGVGTGAEAMVEQSIWGKIADFISSPIDFLKNIVTNWAGNSLGSDMGQMLLNIPMDFAEGIVDSLLDLVGLGEASVGQVDVTDAGALGGSAMQQVASVAARYGWDSGAQWNALVRLVQKESSWNPAAANPTSSARGLFQKMTSIHGPIEPTAAGQATWGLNYIQDRYGDPVRALRFHDANGWYGKGGLIEGGVFGGLTPYLHDDGGVIDPGWNLIYNATRQPEASLNPQQLDNIQRIADQGGRASLIGQVTIPTIAQDPHEIVDELHHALDVADLGGRYGEKD